MAEHSKIEWCDSTWNPWIGCTKVSPACDRCYAEAMAARYGWVEWGVGKQRRRTSEENWKKPRRWQKAAGSFEKGQRQRRVFCLSLGDWADPEIPVEWRADLFREIEATPDLEWLLLTKRHALARRFLPATPWPHVRIGMTVENETMARTRLPRLAALALEGGWKTFVSYEPALERINWWPWLDPDGIAGGCLQWIICGGESGPGARHMDVSWARELRDECKIAGVPFFFKQMARKAPIPADLMVREFPA